MAKEACVRRLLVHQSAKIDPKACDKGVVVFQATNMATEVCLKSGTKILLKVRGKSPQSKILGRYSGFPSYTRYISMNQLIKQGVFMVLILLVWNGQCTIPTRIPHKPICAILPQSWSLPPSDLAMFCSWRSHSTLLGFVDEDLVQEDKIWKLRIHPTTPLLQVSVSMLALQSTGSFLDRQTSVAILANGNTTTPLSQAFGSSVQG